MVEDSAESAACINRNAGEVAVNLDLNALRV